MINWNSIRKPLILLALVTLLVACSSSAVETTPTADAPPALTAAPTEAHATPAQSTATASVTPGASATTTPVARQTIVVEEYPIVASGVYTPDRFEYTGYITPTVLERRQAWRSLPPVKVVESTNQVLARFGFRLEPNPIKSNYEYRLYQGNILIQDQVYGFRPPTVNQRGDDFCLWVQTAKGDKVICRQDNIAWPPGPYSYTPPIYFGNELLMAHYEDGRVLVQQSGKTIYSMSANFMAASPLKGLWAWDGRWVLEVDGQVVIDGKSLNKELGYDEIFHWRPLKGQPFYFFKKGDRVGVSYAGQVLPYQYDQVIHYRCCEPAMFNVGGNETMVWFHARKGGMWYYVEMGVYQ